MQGTEVRGLRTKDGSSAENGWQRREVRGLTEGRRVRGLGGGRGCAGRGGKAMMVHALSVSVGALTWMRLR